MSANIRFASSFVIYIFLMCFSILLGTHEKQVAKEEMQMKNSNQCGMIKWSANNVLAEIAKRMWNGMEWNGSETGAERRAMNVLVVN